MNSSQVYISCKMQRSDTEMANVYLSLESLIIYCTYKYNNPINLSINFVYDSALNDSNTGLHLCIPIENNIKFINYSSMPWEIQSCSFPVASSSNTIMTGLCAVCRLICKHTEKESMFPEHEEGLLGFRKGCLQAPNETSVWTKFCEIDILKTIQDVLLNLPRRIPDNIYRYENHLRQPVKIHNFLKVTQDMNSKKLENLINFTEKLSIEDSVTSSTCKLNHTFAEGPFVTLADLMLWPCFFILKFMYGENVLKTYLPKINEWINNIEKLDKFKVILDIMKGVDLEKFIKYEKKIFETLSIPDLPQVSLYKHDVNRHNPRRKVFTKQKDIDDALAKIATNVEYKSKMNEIAVPINWKTVPDGANPNAGHLPEKRSVRKAQQLENLAVAVADIAKDGDKIVDFCSGGGHLGILLACLLPKCTILLVENKEQSLVRAKKRVDGLNLNNVYFFQCNLDFFVGKFDIGVALHACGIASDLVLDKCLKCNAKFVICPCCYGSLHQTDRIVYPRSNVFSKYIEIEDYMCIGHAADQTHTDHPLEKRGERCMGVIDSDRAKLAEQVGYNVSLLRLNPLSCTPKNNLLIGIPK